MSAQAYKKLWKIIMLGTSDAWSMNRLSHRPNKPEYYTEYCWISDIDTSQSTVCILVDPGGWTYIGNAVHESVVLIAHINLSGISGWLTVNSYSLAFLQEWILSQKKDF